MQEAGPTKEPASLIALLRVPTRLPLPVLRQVDLAPARRTHDEVRVPSPDRLVLGHAGPRRRDRPAQSRDAAHPVRLRGHGDREHEDDPVE